MLAFKISRFSIRNLAIIFNSHKSVNIHISPCEHGRSEKTSQYLVAGRWLSWFETVVPEVLLQIFGILLPICWRVAFWLWVLRRKIYGSSLDHKMYIPSCSYCQRCHWQTHLQRTRPSRLSRLAFTFFDPATGCSEGGTQHFLGLWRHSVSGQLATFPTSMLGFQIGFQFLQTFEIPNAPRVGGFLEPKLIEIGFLHFLGRNSKTGRRWSASFGCGWRFAKCLDANGQMVYKFKRQVTMISEVRSSG